MRLMGDALATKRWVRERLRLLSRRAGLDYVPTLVWTEAEWRRRCSHHSAADATHRSNLGYSCNLGCRIVYVAWAEHLCRHQINDTLAHEMVHLRWPSLNHVALFYTYVDALRHGTRFGPPGSPLPAALKKGGTH